VRIARVDSWRERIALSRPYRIAFQTTDAVELFFVRLADDEGNEGLGSASPSEAVTGESAAACAAALEPGALQWLVGQPGDAARACARSLEHTHAATPAARAAVDVALHDLWARRRGEPLVDALGRVHDALPTSITIGIKGEAETLAEAAEYVGRGFRRLKVKIGGDEDFAARLLRLREAVPADVELRVDANKGLDLPQALQLGRLGERLRLELIEQPLEPARDEELRALPEAVRRRLALDESVLGEQDAARLAAAGLCGAFVVKLMKCGGVGPAMGIAATARAHGLGIMWGCMDESAVSIAAALHAAYAAEATRWLDLDGSLDLARDPAQGGFVVDGGRLRTLPAPGLGARIGDGAGPR
jgi:L-alanine-DL-glutamate epimerase-like enolase superfamily enzyme